MSAPKPDNAFGPETAGERWVDALLTEHARLGRDGEDEELVYRILANTVHANTLASPLPSRRPAEPRRWAGLGLTAAIAALLTLLLVALFSIPSSRKSAQSEELRFVVRILEPAAPEMVPSPTLARIIPDRTTPVASLAEPLLVRGVPSLARIEWLSTARLPGTELATAPSLRSEDLRIQSERQQRVDREVVYEGKVLVEHSDFRIEAERVKLRAPGAPAEDGEAPLLAEGVRVVQSSTDCVAEAEELRYDPASASLLLTGISRVSTARGELAHFAPDERLVLSPTGFSIESAALPMLRRR